MANSARRTCSLCWLLSLILTATAPATGAQVKKGKDAEDAKWKEYELAPEEPHDLLSLVRLPDHALRGTWKKLDGSFVCEPSADAQLTLPIAVSGSYRIECEFTRRTGEETIVVVLPVGTSSTAILLSGWTGAASGIARVSGRDARDSKIVAGAAVRPGKLANGRRYKLEIDVTVIRDRAIIQASLNGQKFVMWKGLTSQVSYWPQYSVPCQQSIALIAHEAAADFHACTITVDKGSLAYRLEGPNKTDWLTPLTRVEDEPPRQIAAQCATWNGRKYYMTDKPVEIVEARRLAAELGGRLLTISSVEENEFFFKVARGVQVWLSGWKRSGDTVWRDERNRPLRYVGKWVTGQPSGGYWETSLGIITASTDSIGWNDFWVINKLHACIEWGEEYPEAKGPSADGQAQWQVPAVEATTGRVPGAREGESLKVVERTAGTTRMQDMWHFRAARWSGRQQLWWTGAKPGDRLSLEVPVETAGLYELFAVMTQGPDYGIVQPALDGRSLGEPVDLFSSVVQTTGIQSLGTRELTSGNHRFDVTIKGLNPKAIKAWMFGLDYLYLVPRAAG